MKQQSGFTLIELIMVIVILGVLSAFALPRFADLGKDARIANLKGLEGSIKSAANIAHAKQLVSGKSGNQSISLEGAPSVSMVNGYPSATSAGIVRTVNLDGYTTTGTNPVKMQLKTNCHVEYTAAAQSGSNITPPKVKIVDTGC